MSQSADDSPPRVARDARPKSRAIEFWYPTGTAEATDEAGAEVYYASFVGSVLDREPRFVALVGLEVPEGKATGASAAAPAWAKLASRILSDR